LFTSPFDSEKSAYCHQGAYRTDEGKPLVLECVRQAERRIAGTNFMYVSSSLSSLPSFVRSFLLLFLVIPSLIVLVLSCREYLPMGGSVVFNDHSMKLAYGEEASVLADKRVAGIQALSGTGACRLFADFQRRFKPESSIFIPVPTWAKYASSDDLHSLHVVPSEQTNVLYTIVALFFLVLMCSLDVCSHHNIWRDAHVPQHTFRYYDPATKGLDFAGLMEDVKV
jgi:aspartate aminotransferase